MEEAQPPARPARLLPALPVPLSLAVLSAALLAHAAAPPPADARPRPVDLEDGGGSALAYEFTVPLRVTALRSSVPTSWLPSFRKTQGKGARLHFSQRAQLAELFAELRKVGGEAADALTLGDAWLGPAVAAGLLAPIPRAEGARWRSRLPAGWEALVRRGGDGSPSPHGALFGVPYRWGCTLLALRTDRGPACDECSDWEGLWAPGLAGRVAVPASSRELLALALRSLGCSPNTPSPRRLPPGVSAAAVEERVRTLWGRQARTLAEGGGALKALALGDVWAVVGSSIELLAFAQRTPNVRVIAPASGTQLWADLWVLPARRAAAPGGPSPLLPQWYDFTTSPARAQPAMGVKMGASPLLMPPFLPEGEPPARSAPRPCAEDAALVRGGLFPSPAVLSRSAFLLPLPAEGAAEWAELLRRAGVAADR